MRNSAVIFLFVGNNHISNVKSLQSIFRQDYDNICLIICNDSTYGFENERFLNNFRAGRNTNIRQVYFQENPYPMGEYASLMQFDDKLCGDFLVILHSGEYFVSSSALRQCINCLKQNPMLDMVLLKAEKWTGNFKTKIGESKILENIADYSELSKEKLGSAQFSCVRDCMVAYRVSAFYEKQHQIENTCTHISQYLVPELIEDGKCAVCISNVLCRYSDESIYEENKRPTELFRNTALHNVELLLSEKTQPTEKIFANEFDVAAKRKKRNLWVTMYQLSTFVRIKAYASISILAFIAAGLFLNVENDVVKNTGIMFFAGAILGIIWVLFMIIANLYLKKNPQRLVKSDGK